MLSNAYTFETFQRCGQVSLQGVFERALRVEHDTFAMWKIVQKDEVDSFDVFGLDRLKAKQKSIFEMRHTRGTWGEPQPVMHNCCI